MEETLVINRSARYRIQICNLKKKLIYSNNDMIEHKEHFLAVASAPILYIDTTNPD